MSGDAIACLFASAPIRDCGRLPSAETVLASSWPLIAMGIGIAALCGFAFLRSLYQHEIDWGQEPEPKPLRPIEDIARDAGL